MIFDFSGAALAAGLFWETSFEDFGGGRDSLRLTVAGTAAVPEPETILVLLGGLTAIRLLRRKRRKIK